MPLSETPIIIGVGDIKDRTSNHKEPAVLIHEAILAAIKDSSSSDATVLQSSIDSISIVKTWTWPYPDLPGLLATKLGVEPNHKFYSEHGGEKPGKLFDEAAKRVARGETKVAVVAGGEALASRKFTLHGLCSGEHCICAARRTKACSDSMCGRREAAPARLDEAIRICAICLHTNRHGSWIQ
jgi:hypothetical protein